MAASALLNEVFGCVALSTTFLTAPVTLQTGPVANPTGLGIARALLLVDWTLAYSVVKSQVFGRVALCTTILAAAVTLHAGSMAILAAPRVLRLLLSCRWALAYSVVEFQILGRVALSTTFLTAPVAFYAGSMAILAAPRVLGLLLSCRWALAYSVVEFQIFGRVTLCATIFAAAVAFQAESVATFAGLGLLGYEVLLGGAEALSRYVLLPVLAFEASCHVATRAPHPAGNAASPLRLVVAQLAYAGIRCRVELPENRFVATQTFIRIFNAGCALAAAVCALLHAIGRLLKAIQALACIALRQIPEIGRRTAAALVNPVHVAGRAGEEALITRLII